MNDAAAWATAPETVPVAAARPVAGLPVRSSVVVKKEASRDASWRREEEAARLDSARKALSVLMGQNETEPVAAKQ